MTRMPRPILHDVKHWRDSADEARQHAEQMDDPATKRLMLEVAESYVEIAKRAALRPRSPPEASAAKGPDEGKD